MAALELAQQCFLLTENNGKEFHAGSKARNDADVIFSRYGFKRLINYAINNNVGRARGKGFSYYCNRAANCGRSYFGLRSLKGKILFAQYPDYSPRFFQGVIRKLFMANKAVFLIHDVDLLRSFGEQKNELALLNQASILIVHNDAMAEELQVRGVIKPYMINLQLFDYLAEPPKKIKQYQKAVVFAGNLGKSQFLTAWLQLSREYEINLYGIGLDTARGLPAHTNYCGSYPPDELPEAISGGFGLVWDGDSAETGHGPMGEYTKYNNPHKFSLYIAAGIPVIVWKQAAVAKLVEKYKVGFCVESLSEINSILAQVTIEQYHKFVYNLQVLQTRVLEGKFLQDAVDKSLCYLFDKLEIK